MDKFTPALPKFESPSTLNDVMFQSMLSSWLEDKGFITEIQSQIRYKLINILRNTAVGKNSKLLKHNNFLRQALNMIVVEYLFSNDYEYSLSVFSTEAALTHVMPNNLLHSPSNQGIHKKLDYVDILHIFELLGLPEASAISSEILKIYQQETKFNSLLLCLVNLLKKQTKNEVKVKLQSNNDETDHFDATTESNLEKQITTFLEKYNVPNNKIKSLIENINEIILSKRLKYKMEIEIKEKIIDSMSKKKRKLENSLFKLAKNYTSQEIVPTNGKENVITENNLNKHLELQKEYDCVRPHCGTICKSNLDAIEELKKENYILRTAMFELKNTNVAQHKELITLSMKCNDLVNAFKDCQNTLLLLTSRESSVHNQILHQQSQSKHFLSKGKMDINYKSEELSSESVTEEIVKEARNRLNLLDNESNAMEA